MCSAFCRLIGQQSASILHYLLAQYPYFQHFSVDVSSICFHLLREISSVRRSHATRNPDFYVHHKPFFLHFPGVFNVISAIHAENSCASSWLGVPRFRLIFMANFFGRVWRTILKVVLGFLQQCVYEVDYRAADSQPESFGRSAFAFSC